MSAIEKDDLDLRTHSVIQLCLSDEVSREVADEDLLMWLKLESLFMTKSLPNLLYLKQWLYTLRMKEGIY